MPSSHWKENVATADTEAGRREIMATLRPMLDYLWPAAPGKRC